MDPIDPSELTIAPANKEDAPAASAILMEAVEWQAQRGSRMWTSQMLTEDTCLADIEQGKLYLAWHAGEAVGMFHLQWEDAAFWPDVPAGELGFLHRLAVRRSVAGRGVSTAMVEWAKGAAKAAGKAYLRLDCAAERPKLRAFYEQLGFVFHSTRDMNGWLTARYEFRL